MNGMSKAQDGSLDKEWVELMAAAKKYGITKEQIRGFLDGWILFPRSQTASLEEKEA